MLAQKTLLKEEICLHKMEHFTRTFETLSPDIYTGMQIANADNMYLYCTAHFRCARFCTGWRGNQITRVRLGRVQTTVIPVKPGKAIKPITP